MKKNTIDNTDGFLDSVMAAAQEDAAWLVAMRAALEAHQDARVIEIASILTNYEDPARERAAWVAVIRHIWERRHAQ